MSNDKAKFDKKNNKVSIENISNSDYSKLTKQELTNIAKSYNLKNISALKKEQLIEKIKEYKEKQEEKIPNYKKSPHSEYSKQKLNELAKEYKIKNYSRMGKVDLIKAIDKHLELKSSDPKINTEEKVETTNNTNDNNLESLNMTSLVGIAKDLKVKGYSKLSKLKLIKSIHEIKNSANDKLIDIKDSIVEKTNNISENIKDKVEEIKENASEGIEEISKNISKAKDKLIETVSEIKESLTKENKSKTKENLKKDKKTKTLKSEKEDVKKVEKEYLSPELNSAETIEKIAQKTELTFVDRREANSVEEELKHKILLTPSKFGFGKTNEEFLLKDEEKLELPELYEEDKITLLPVDPTKMFTYWDISTETINKFIINNIRDFYLKINDVTGIMYNGYNANLYWMEKCSIEVGDWYIYLNQGGRNFCVEIGYISQGEFNIIAKSNTIMVPAGKASEIISDTFVIANYPKLEARSRKIDKELASDRYITREIKQRTSPYYELNDYTIAGNYNLRKMPKKMPVFTLVDEIPQHFVEEYKITNEKFVEPEKIQEVQYSPPEKITITTPPPIALTEVPTNNNFLIPIENKELDYYKNNEYKEPEFYEDEQIINEELVDDYSRGFITPLNENISYSEPLKVIKKEIPQTIYSYFESIPNFNKDKILVDSFYYHVPGEPQKAIRVYYDWVENETPYRKEFFWVSDPLPQVHQNIYKVSWGPTWVKEFIGGSEQIKFIGASERFLGSSDIYLGGSEFFIESSGRYLGSSEYFLGSSDQFAGGSEQYIGSSDKYSEWDNEFSGSSENLIGGSENIHKSNEFINLFSDEFIPKNFKVRTQDYKGIKDRYKL
jgi:hypothetical protein